MPMLVRKQLLTLQLRHWQAVMLLALLVSLRAAEVCAEEPPTAAFEWTIDGRAIALDTRGAAYVSTPNELYVLDRTLPAAVKRTPSLISICNFHDVAGIAVLADGSFLTANYCLQKFDNALGLVWERVQPSTSVAVDGEGRIYTVSPSNAVLRWSPQGVLRDQWLAVDLGAGRFQEAGGIAVDPDGFIYLADTGNDLVQKYDLDMNPITSWMLDAEGDHYTKPAAICVDKSGNVYVTTLTPPHVFKYSPAGDLLTHWGSSGPVSGSIHAPTGIAVNDLGDVYVVDQGIKIVVFGTRQPGDPPPPISFTPLLPIPPPRPPPPTMPVPPATIQGMIDLAPGPTVIVPPGTYRGSIDFRNRTLELVGQAGAERTIIDGSAHPNDPAVRIGAGVQGGVLRGFTITGSRGESTILVEGATVSIRDNIIRDNAAIGINIRTGTVDIRRNSFLNNDHWTTHPSFGGAISVVSQDQGGTGTAIIEDNVFRGNRSGFGSAFYASDAVVEFRNNLVEDNWCYYDGGAIFMWPSMKSAVIEKNRFLRNTAGDHGGAIAAWHVYSGHSDIRFNLFAHNRANGDGAHGRNGTGGAIHIAAASGTFTNNTVVFNSAGQECGGGGVTLDRYDWIENWLIEKNIIAWNGKRGVICADRASASIVRNNIIFGNNLSDLNCSGVSSRTLATFEYNHELDPMFCDPGGGNYQLAAASPARNGLEHWGAYPDVGCALVPVVPSTWSSIKARLLGDR